MRSLEEGSEAKRLMLSDLRWVSNWYWICTLTRVITRVYLNEGPPVISEATTRGKEKRSPLNVYLPEPQAARLNELCKVRHVTKATIVRSAVDEFFVMLNDGQFELPLELTQCGMKWSQ